MNKTVMIESSLYGNQFKLANQHEMELKVSLIKDQFELVTPPELAVNSDDIIPAGLPIRTTAFIVDKMDVAVCDGRDHWFVRISGSVKSVSAGQPWSALF